MFSSSSTKNSPNSVDSTHINGENTARSNKFNSFPVKQSDSFLFFDSEETSKIYKTIISNGIDPIFIQKCVQHEMLIRPQQISQLLKLQAIFAIKYGCIDSENKYIHNILVSRGLISEEIQTKSFKDLINPFPEESIESFILKDDEINFNNKISETAFNPNKSVQVEEDSPLYFLNGDKSITYMQLIAFYGSINCFKCALRSGRFDVKNIEKYAIAGGNNEIIDILQQKGVMFNNCFETAVKYHRNDILDWLLENYPCGQISLSKAIEFYNIDAYDFIFNYKLSNVRENASKFEADKSYLEAIRTMSEKAQNAEIDVKYDDSQRDVILINKGHHLVLAGPGCGKTDILAARVVNAINNGVPVSDMLCLTFTNRAAREMKKRISEKSINTDGLFIGNIHSFCIKFIDNELIDDVKSKMVINDTKNYNNIYNLQHAVYQIERKYPQELIKDYNLLHEKRLLYQKSANYKTFKDRYGLVDFDDLLLLTYEYALQNQSKIKKYKWIQVDEIQDLSPIMLKIISLFTDENGTTVYLGDKMQSIFSFIGAASKGVDELKSRFKDNVHYLRNNYRSPKYLLDVFNKYSQKTFGVEPLICSLNSKENKGDYMSIIMPASTEAIPYLVNSFQKENPNDRTAILSFTNRQSADISCTLDRNKIGYFNVSLNDVFKQDQMQLILSHLKVLRNETNNSSWVNILVAVIPKVTINMAYDCIESLQRHYICPTDFIVYENTSYLLEAEKVYQGVYIIYDTETTGLDVYHDDIVEISALKINNSQIIDKIDIVMETDKQIPEKLGQLENPLIKKYKESKRFNRKEGLLRFMQFIGDLPLIGHNSERFDNVILNNNIKKYCQTDIFEKQSRSFFDTLTMSQIIEPKLREHNLKNLLLRLNLEGENSHLSEDDIIATKSVLDYCMDKFRKNKENHISTLKGSTYIRETLKNNYGTLYIEAKRRMYNVGKDSPILVEEMKKAYNYFTERKIIEENSRVVDIVFKYIEKELIDTNIYPRLHQQLEKYTREMGMLMEADLYGSSVINEKVFISTIHKAKGLEFENVIIFKPKQRFYGKVTREDIEERKRVFYVAMTRAMKRLIIVTDEQLPGDIFGDFKLYRFG